MTATTTMSTVRAALWIAALALMGGLVGCGDDGIAPQDPNGPNQPDRTVASVAVASGGSLTGGDTVRLSATARTASGTVGAPPTARTASGTVVEGMTVAWSTDDAAVAQITAAGATVLVHGHGPGTTRIRAVVSGKEGTAAVRVTEPVETPPPAVHTIVVQDASGAPGGLAHAILEPGVERVVGAAALAADGTPVPGIQFTWRSADATVATVTPLDGTRALIRALRPGAAVVSAEAAGRAGRATVHVPAPSESTSAVQIHPGELLVELGAEVELSADAWASDGSWIDEPRVLWLSGDPAVVEATGLTSGGRVRLRGLAPGTATVTAYSGGRTATARIRVKAAPGVGGVAITPFRRGLWRGDLFRFQAHVIASTGGSLADYPVRWSVEDASVASVRADGRVQALRAGRTRVTATSGGRTATAEIEVFDFPSSGAVFTLLPNVEPPSQPRVTVRVGTTTWVDAAGVAHAAEKWLVGGTLALDLPGSSYEQTLTVDVVVLRPGQPVHVVGRETWVDRGRVLFDLLDGYRYRLESDVRPGTTVYARFVEGGLLTLRQAVGTAAELDWLYGM